MNVNKLLILSLGAAALVPAVAGATAFDFATGANNTNLGPSITVGPVTAEAFDTPTGDGLTFAASDLWLRNQTNDHGLGVCSEGDGNCATAGGDYNEIDNLGSFEYIRLTNNTDGEWTSLWVSSLDSGGQEGRESGRLYWSDSATSFNNIDAFSFFYDTVTCNIECDLFSLAGFTSVFNTSAKYLLFASNEDWGDNNDYLVWKGAVSGRSGADHTGAARPRPPGPWRLAPQARLSAQGRSG